MKTMILSLAAAASLGGAMPAAAKPAAPVTSAQEMRVPLFQLGHFQTFRAIGRDTVYIRGIGRQWYRVATMGPCPNLPWARAIGLDTRGVSTLDRFSTLIVEGDRCPVASVTLSAEPPRRSERRRAARDARR